MTQDERISFIKNPNSNSQYSQIQNPIFYDRDSDDDEIQFLSLSQCDEIGISKSVPNEVKNHIVNSENHHEKIIPVKIDNNKAKV